MARATLYVTFGTMYGTPEERERWGKQAHPAGDWVTGNGYLAVEYDDEAPTLSGYSDPDQRLLDARERARMVAWTWLGGRYAFEYDRPPEPRHAPAGEIARIVLP